MPEDATEGPSKEAAAEAAKKYQQAVCHEITGETMPPTLQDAIKLLQCANVEGYNHPNWSCVLRTCTSCPNYKASIPDHEEQAEVDELTRISFDVYVAFTKCSKHGVLELNAKTCRSMRRGDKQDWLARIKKGKIRTKKELTRKTTSIEEFP